MLTFMSCDGQSLIFNHFSKAMAFSLDFRIQVPLCHLSLPPKIVSFHLYSNIWTSGKTVTKCQWTTWVCIIPGSQLAKRTFRSRHHWLFHTLLTYITIQISLQLGKKNLFCKVISNIIGLIRDKLGSHAYYSILILSSY